MVKSKRAQVVHLTKAKKKTKEDKQRLIEKIKDSFSTYEYIYLIRVDNMRNTFLKQFREDYIESKIFFGKTTIMAKALEMSEEEALSQFSQHISGINVGLVFSNDNSKDFKKYCETLNQKDYARIGFIAPETVEIPKGSIKVNGELISHTLESQLKENGMPVSIKKGIITLDDDYTICNEGDTLTSEQCKLLKIFDIQLTQSRIIPLMCYTKGCIESLEL